MKNQIILFLCLACPLNAINSNQLTKESIRIDRGIVEYSVKHKNNKLIEHYKNLLLGMMAQESRTGQILTGDGGAAKGILHIHKSFVDNINKVCKTNYTYDDRLSSVKSIEMFLLFQEHYNPTQDYEIGAKLWNGGQNCDLNNPNLIKYWDQVSSHIEKQTNVLLANTIIETFKNNV